ncbi:hypothetical protein WBP06_25045 [Novosphingobium sp. BL-8H]|uniref:hypothetical protein n=1 Tax=Novosphingobium sp. BL-8H TaxID=3127640 RepID=UPI0037574B6C
MNRKAEIETADTVPSTALTNPLNARTAECARNCSSTQQFHTVTVQHHGISHSYRGPAPSAYRFIATRHSIFSRVKSVSLHDFIQSHAAQ